jgi:hypothetical protein
MKERVIDKSKSFFKNVSKSKQIKIGKNAMQE